ncbi:MBL fold metallo-hydrolase [soil metagenome]
MRLTVVGCSGSFPGPESPASCYLLQAPYEGRTYALVLDLGNGALGALQRHVELADVDAVALSHLHVDHSVDLASFYVVRSYHPAGRLPRLPVVAPAGAAAWLARLYDLPETSGMSDVFDFAAWTAGEPLRLGPFLLRVARVSHPVEAYAVRVDAGGRSLVYSGDTGPCGALVDLARGADVLLCEASFLEGADNPPDLHLTGREAGEHAAAAGVGRLLLTHVPPWHDPQQVLSDARPAFAGPLDLARPDATYPV